MMRSDRQRQHDVALDQRLATESAAMRSISKSASLSEPPSIGVLNGGRDLSVAVAHPLLAKCAIDAAGDGIAKPDHDAEQKHGQGKLKGINHESTP